MERGKKKEGREKLEGRNRNRRSCRGEGEMRRE